MISDPDDLWRHQPEPPAVDLEVVRLRKLITDTADNYAQQHDHVVVLDDIVAEEIARVVADRYGLGAP